MPALHAAAIVIAFLAAAATLAALFLPEAHPEDLLAAGKQGNGT